MECPDLNKNPIEKETESKGLWKGWGTYSFDDLDKIVDHLYLSGCHSADHHKTLQKYDIKHILSIFDDELTKVSETITYEKIKIDDHHEQEILTLIPEAIEFISKAVDAKENVLVHCHMGISRSASFVIAYLMSKNQWPYDKAEQWVRNRRQAIYPNEGFVYQLRLFEEIGFTLKESANNLKLRRFLIRSFMNLNIYWLSQFKNRIEEYYEKRDFIESLTENLNLGADCLCAKCNYKLFNEIHMIFNTEAEAKVKCESGKARKVCDYTYIEPQKWMKELLQDFNTFGSSVAFVRCPECEIPLVEYMRYYKDFGCYCPKHKAIPKCLLFRIKTENFKIVSKD